MERREKWKRMGKIKERKEREIDECCVREEGRGRKKRKRREKKGKGVWRARGRTEGKKKGKIKERGKEREWGHVSYLGWLELDNVISFC
jgi:hypothetical protein